jgi:hypothetical protein
MDEGNRIIQQSGLKIISSPDLYEASKIACKST